MKKEILLYLFFWCDDASKKSMGRDVILRNKGLWLNSQLQETHAKLDSFGEEEVNQYLVGLLKSMKAKARIYEIGALLSGCC